MKKETIVISLGGSQIIPDDINYKYIKKFKEIILSHKNKYKFIIVCGGGSLARKYIKAIKKEKISEYYQSLAGISATRNNARFMYYFFNIEPKKGVPQTKRALKKYLKEEELVFCGALEYKENQTSDSVAADLARKFKTKFINLTNVKGLYDKDPKKFKNTKFIPEISWESFDKIVKKIKFSPGQHFILDQNASNTIKKYKITTYVIKELKELNNLLNNKKFVGTKISG